MDEHDADPGEPAEAVEPGQPTGAAVVGTHRRHAPEATPAAESYATRAVSVSATASRGSRRETTLETPSSPIETP